MIVASDSCLLPLRSASGLLQLAPCFLSIVGHDEGNALHQGPISPVDAIGVITVIRLNPLHVDEIHSKDVTGVAHVLKDHYNVSCQPNAH